MISTGVKLARLKWLEDKLSRNTALRIGRTGVMCWVNYRGYHSHKIQRLWFIRQKAEGSYAEGKSRVYFTQLKIAIRP
jgi:hypothetical protein